MLDENVRSMFDENISWKEHIKTVENKNIGFLCKAKQLLANELLKSIYFSYIHSYLNHANIAWTSTNPAKLKKYIICNNNQRKQYLIKIDYAIHGHFLKNLNVVKVYQIYLYQSLNFMHRIKMENIPETIIKKTNYKYSKTFSNFTYSIKKHSLKLTKY